MAQLKEAVKIVDAKYPKADGWQVVWTFDHSCDALQGVHESWWGGKPHSLNFPLGISKGMQRVLEKKGVDT